MFHQFPKSSLPTSQSPRVFHSCSSVFQVFPSFSMQGGCPPSDVSWLIIPIIKHRLIYQPYANFTSSWNWSYKFTNWTLTNSWTWSYKFTNLERETPTWGTTLSRHACLGGPAATGHPLLAPWQYGKDDWASPAKWKKNEWWIDKWYRFNYIYIY